MFLRYEIALTKPENHLNNNSLRPILALDENRQVEYKCVITDNNANVDNFHQTTI